MKNKNKRAKTRSILAIIAIVAVIGFSIMACGGSDDDSGGGGGGGGGYNGLLIGKWYQDKDWIALAAAGNTYAVCDYEFKSDGKLIVGGYVEMTYTATANTVMMANGRGEEAYYTISENGNYFELIITATDNSGFTSGTYYKAK